ncbi:hypothetical protein BDN70DRAFT_877286 [Pholiota conissans]|uniref:Uncharacterized protein n=1 Tax=Pholiota conissans TaxID=109636 RepID=A0A9P6D218_9AGAR|nr:hypothetical protein BDN70DRAFT_877286 [Pholiota conissans]
MLPRLETPRPLPPAKARRASAMQKLSSSPPPAYGSPFTFPARRHTRQDILGSPMATTFQMVGWDAVGEHPLPSETPDDMAWINEKSREELKDLLLKADDIIRERENEIGITSAVCKGLYQNNITLKTKHEELLARIPSSPARSISSPANLYHQPPLLQDDTGIVASSSESALEFISSPQPSPKRHARKVSIAVADVCLLSDQNAELLDKLEKLEKEATSTDQAGRRELKRLEKEIAFLREELEKTQARSDELEEKVQGAVASEAWRRKKEREAKFRAMRNLAQDEQRKVRSFAPEGSKFGGPSEAFSFFPTAESPDPNRRRPSYTTSGINEDTHSLSLGSHEHALIEQLLIKVQELEETNVKILRQQSETATQLSAVQRDTAHISRVYDCLNDQNSVELEFADDHEENAGREKDIAMPGEAIRFMSLKRTLANEEYCEGTCIVRPDLTPSGKTRKTVMGLFDVQQTVADEQEKYSERVSGDISRLYASSSQWSEGPIHDDNSSWSSVPGAVSPSSRLSPLHFFSPLSHGLAELSPIGDCVTLQSELGQSWAEMQQRNDAATMDDVFHHNHHLRTSSLYDLTQMSVPPSPSPTSRAVSRRPSDELDYQAVKHALNQRKNGRDEHALDGSTPRISALLMPINSLHLSVEPPTPEKQLGHRTTGAITEVEEAAPILSHSPLSRSPRVKLISDTLRSRANRWADRRLREREGEIQNNGDTEALPGVIGPTATAMGIPRHLLNAVDSMIDGFDNAFLGNTKGVYKFPEAPDDDEHHSSPVTPYGRYEEAHIRRRPSHHKKFDSDDQAELCGELQHTDVQLHAGASPLKTASDYENQGIMLKVWLWIQFGIVVFVFLYAMARRGPTIVLTEESKKAVAKRR